jgi:hypothetical protein
MRQPIPGLERLPHLSGSMPGNVSVEQMERIYGDVASPALKLNKPFSAWSQPLPGKRASR